MPALTFPLAGTLSRSLNVTRRWPVAGGVDPATLGPHLLINFTDPTLMSQDAVLSVPVTAVNDPVGHVDDLSAGATPVQQTTAADRPTLQRDGNGVYCVRTDGLGDKLTGTVASFGGSKKATVITAYRMNGNAGAANGIYLLGASDTDAGAMELYQYNASGLHYSSVAGTSQLQGGVTVPAAVAIVTQQFDLTNGTVIADSLRVWVNGVEQSPTYLGGPPGSSALGLNTSLVLGAMAFGNYPAAVDYYYYAIYDDHLTTAQREGVETFINNIVGAY